MSLLKPFNTLPDPNTANILLVEKEEKFQQRLASALVGETDVVVTVRVASTLPLPMEIDESRPRIDLVVFIINLTSEFSFLSAQASLKYLDPGYLLGKTCFMVTNARNASVPEERLDAVRRLVASLHCPLLFAEDQTPSGVTAAADRLLTILRVASGVVPMATALSWSNLTRCVVPPDLDQPSFD